MTPARASILALLALPALACQPSPEAPVRAQLAALERALRYQDLEGVYHLHIDSVGAGALCEPSRRALWERTASPSPQACQEASALLRGQEPAPEELTLLSQIVALRCQQPALGCRELSARLSQQQARGSALLAAPVERLEIQQITLRGPDEAVAYVDLRGPDGDNPRRVTLHLAQTQGRWLLASWP